MAATKVLARAFAGDDGVGDDRADNGHDDADHNLRHPILHVTYPAEDLHTVTTRRTGRNWDEGQLLPHRRCSA
jgi:hypothetical protein